MEADWEFELGADAPVIEAHWVGFLDLRHDPARAFELPEAARFPALARALARLNASHSPVWTSKCDFFPALAAAEFDADELDAPIEASARAVACYIDVLPRSDQQWPFPKTAAQACRQLCARLRAIPLRCCRADLIIRRAIVFPDENCLGITAYLTACGATEEAATAVLGEALSVFAASAAPAGDQTDSQ